jgi:hypothetical protein
MKRANIPDEHVSYILHAIEHYIDNEEGVESSDKIRYMKKVMNALRVQLEDWVTPVPREFECSRAGELIDVAFENGDLDLCVIAKRKDHIVIIPLGCTDARYEERRIPGAWRYHD